MTHSPARRRDAAEHPTPRAVQLMINKLSAGWTHTVTVGTGTITKQSTDKDLRKHVFTDVDVVSHALRMRHPSGRAAVGIWVDGSFDTAFTWARCTDQACERRGTDHPDGMPMLVKSAALKAWISAPLVDLAKAAPAELAVAA